ncbi:PREDICTED: protein sister of odd and bowel [Nicrophorus vespilloides]|uniref:Protein sister of odd and bowel n=1 Tax=Nicrophorus vespilloides TaxID=110193 RepID=A0ABM1MRX7_NICVS|nr:PREDICTED: protein sister of odd and bowel [Nicrophorus vespilloides]
MNTMKYPNVSGGNNMAVSGNESHVDEVDSLFNSTCWQNTTNEYMDHKIAMDGTMNNLSSNKILLGSPINDSDTENSTKATMDALDNLLLSHPINTNLAELKPLPPFAGYTANLSINGIQGHHYHALAQRIPEENNNSYNNYNEQNIVSSSTCNISADSAGDNGSKSMYSVDEVAKLGYADCVNADSVSSAKMYGDSGHQNADSGTAIKTEMSDYDISSIDDIAAIIGSAIADTTTVPNNHPEEDTTGSRDSWMDLDAWIDGACVDQQKNMIIAQEGLSEFVMPNNNEYKSHAQVQYNTKAPTQQTSSTLQNLLTHGYMPLLQNRLENGPPIKQEVPTSTNYNTDMISTSSPPSNVVSTTDNLMLTVNGRFLPQYGIHVNDDGIRSPDLLGQNYPHTTTTTPNAPKKPRNRAQKKQQQATSSTVFQTEQSLGLLGKEKPVHRCNICNRGFLNKSNIKVHLRTHTGEKPFRCDTCAKAFRQKAHLLKHQQIHKRIGRD